MHARPAIHDQAEKRKMVADELIDEIGFVRTYRELTGASEAQARSAFMFACCLEDADQEAGVELERVLPAEAVWEEKTTHESLTKS